MMKKEKDYKYHLLLFIAILVASIVSGILFLSAEAKEGEMSFYMVTTNAQIMGYDNVYHLYNSDGVFITNMRCDCTEELPTGVVYYYQNIFGVVLRVEQR